MYLIKHRKSRVTLPFFCYFRFTSSREQSAKPVKETRNAICQQAAVLGGVQTVNRAGEEQFPGHYAAGNLLARAGLLAWGSAVSLH